MKIKKKAVGHSTISKEDFKSLSKLLEGCPSSNITKNELDGAPVLIVNDDGNAYKTFKWKSPSGISLIPFVDPVVVYFNLANDLFKEIEINKSIVEIDCGTEDYCENLDRLAIFYDYYAACTNFTIMLFTSIEAFVNQKIPETATYSESFQNKYTKTYSYAQIQQEISFDLKVKKILPEIFQKNFVTEFTNKYKAITKLKTLRNDLIHTKMSSSFIELERLIRKTLDFDYVEVLSCVRDFIEFYDKDLIEQSYH